MINKLDPVDAWLLQKWGKFSASLIYKLNTPGKSLAGFDTYGASYIEDKVMERLRPMTQRPELEYVESLMHGKQYESAAYEWYIKETKNYSMRHFGEANPVFLPFNSYSGGSPDGLMGEGEIIYCGLESKCPSNPKNHYKYCGWKTQFDLKEGRKEYYGQCQFLLMITKADVWHFVSFDESFYNTKKRGKIIEVKPDQKYQDNLEIRLINAEKEVNRLIVEFNNSK